MLNESFLAIVLSSSLVSALVTALFSYMRNRKKDYIENIVKERKAWRDELRIISKSLSKCKNIVELKQLINELKVRINPYGIAFDSIFADSQIWIQIDMLENMVDLSENDFEKMKSSFINFISCILKYDWERAKGEIRGNIQTQLVSFSLLASLALNIAKMIIDESSANDYYSYCVIFMVISSFSLLIIFCSDKWKSLFGLLFLLVGGVLGVAVLSLAYNYFVYEINKMDAFKAIVYCVPFITLIYCTEMRLLSYRKNVRNFILSFAILLEADKIDKRYRVFFNRNVYKNLANGKQITFDKCMLSISNIYIRSNYKSNNL